MKAELPTPDVFNSISKYWSEMADAHATARQIDFLKNQLRPQRLVLDLCCGTGRHAIPLCKERYKMVGLDISIRLLMIAKAKAAGFNIDLPLVRADMRFLPFREAVFSGVVSMDSSFGYLTSETEDLLSVFEVKRILRKNGIFVVDLFNLEHMINRNSKNVDIRGFLFDLFARLPKFKWLFECYEYSNFCLLQKRRIIKKRGILHDLWIFHENTGKTTIAEHTVRLYSLFQLKTLVRKADFEVCRIYGNYEALEYKTDSNRLIGIMVKR